MNCAVASLESYAPAADRDWSHVVHLHRRAAFGTPVIRPDEDHAHPPAAAVDARSPKPAPFDPATHDAGEKTIFGRTGN